MAPMPDGADKYAWAALTRTPGVRVGGLPVDLDPLDPLRKLAVFPPRARAYLAGPARRPSSTEVRWLADSRHDLLPFTDHRFPPVLRALSDCPVALYVDGDAERLCDPQLAIVGSRNPTPQGGETAFSFAQFLARRGLTITSGLAAGIDAAAHRGALAGGAATIAVLACGLDRVYPGLNRELAVEVAKSGALISEFPLGTAPLARNFPRRNRIIAALGLGTLVVEASPRSGSLITARLAAEFGREVFAIPGSIHNPLARGCHELIRQGAKLTESAPDILSELNFSIVCGAPHGAASPPAATPARQAGMDKDHKILLDALGFDPTDLDVLVVRTGFKPEAVSSMMLILELEGHVQAAPGGRYTRVARSS
jgi:DNA processing protein